MQKILGFSLIEVLVSTLIILTLSGIGIASFNNFSQDQAIKQAAADLKNNLRLAQNKAITGEKLCGPEACGGTNSICDGEEEELSLSGWEVGFTLGSEDIPSSYEIYGVCGDNHFSRQTFSLPRKIYIGYISSSDNKVRFKAFPGGVQNSVDICLGGYGRRYKLSISLSGEIIDYGLVSSCP